MLAKTAQTLSELTKKLDTSQQSQPAERKVVNNIPNKVLPQEHNKLTKSKSNSDEKLPSSRILYKKEKLKVLLQKENVPKKKIFPWSKSENKNNNRKPKVKDKSEEEDSIGNDLDLYENETPSRLIKRYSRTPDKVAYFIEKDLNTNVECWRCNKVAIPVVTGEPSSATHIIAGLLCMICFIPCVYLPYWLDCMTTPVKRCANCGAYFTEPTRE